MTTNPESISVDIKSSKLLGPIIGLLRRAEVDRPIIFALLTKSWQLMAGMVTLLLIAHNFSPDLQGYYFTFISLLCMQSFVELGFFIVITNVASHEWAHLELDPSEKIIGDQDHLSRLISLGRLIFKWYCAASIIFLIAVGTGGFIFFSQKAQPEINWQLPWLALVTLVALLLMMSPYNALLEGCNQVATVNKFRLYQAILNNLALWLVIKLGGNLWAGAAAAAINLLCNAYFLKVVYRNFFKPFFRASLSLCISWKREIWPMQWRLAISGLVNYLFYYLFTPVMFYYHGAAVAGQMGMTWAVVNAVQTMALAWIYTKVPRFGILIAHKDYAGLDQFWLRTSVISLLVIIFSSGIVWSIIFTLHHLQFPLAQRLLSPLPTGLFFLAAILMQVSQCQTVYLRAHKQEPIMFLSACSALMIGLLVWLLGSRFGPIGAAGGYLGVTVVIVFWESFIWSRCRRQWHSV